MLRRTPSSLASCLVAAALALAMGTPARGADDVPSKPDNAPTTKPGSRAESLRAVLSHLGVGEGSAVADIGAGSGKDTWVFAEIVGPAGTVFANEIVDGKVKSLKKEAEKRKLAQVRAVLGRGDDPCLPASSVDLAFLHYVYHHIAKPREMLRGMWKSLKPGGYLVIVDKQRGTLRDWVPREVRASKHHWIAETTVTREAREEGFTFVECAEERWHAKDVFVLVFQRPKKLESPGRDPDPFLPLSVERPASALLPLARPYERPVFVALGQSRELIPPILKRSSGPGLEIVLEEWATQKEERPPLPADVSLPSVLTSSGDPGLDPEPIDVVFFLDTYHLLFHSKTLLSKLHEKLSANGCIYVLDREASKPASRREGSHRKTIRPEAVETEMAEAGFHLWFRGPRLAPDRFLLVFGKTQPEKVSPAAGPFFGGPTIDRPPGEWLKENDWRLRGLKATDGRFARFAREAKSGDVQISPASSDGRDACQITMGNLVLSFQKAGDAYSLNDYRFVSGQ